MKLDTQFKRNVAGGLVLLAIFAVVLGGALWLSGAWANVGPATDSGVSACKKMVENMDDGRADNAKWTEADYFAARAPFESSKHADLRVAGTNLVDTIWKSEQTVDDESLGGALGLMSTLQTQMSQLQIACGNHGVAVPQA
jgi:hypothetical protein